jgi:hypothetical protein
MITLIYSLRRTAGISLLASLLICFFCVTLLEQEIAYALPPQNPDDAPRGPSVRSGSPFSSSGTYLKIGISPAAHYGDYTLGYGFQYPIGFEHAAVAWWGEGFTFGYTTEGGPFYGTSYESEPGVQNLTLISATVITDTPTEAVYETVLRTTDGKAELIHRFHFLKDRKFVTLTAIIKNIGSTTLNGVRYRRIWDFDMDNTVDSGDGFNIDISRFMLYAWETHYAALAASPLNPPTEWDFDAWDDVNTYLPGSITYTGPFPVYGDYNVRLEWVYETLAPGASKQIVMYNIGGDSLADIANSYDLATAQAKQWTFMVYLDGDNDLEGAAIDDLNEMEAAGSDASVNIVVQFDRRPGWDSSNGDWTTCKRFYVTKDPDGYNSTIVSTELADLGECNMGDPNTLIDFAVWAKTNYPAQRYALVIWDHGGGWKIMQARLPTKGVAWDDTNGGDYITTPELRSAMQSIYSSYGAKVDIVGFDACLMAMAEMDYELAPYAQYRVGSEQIEPGDGWDYVASMTWLVGNPTATPQALAGRIVHDYGAFYGPDQTLSAVDLSTVKTPTLASDLHTLATNLMNNMASYRTGVQAARASVKEYSDRDYIDLYHFVQLIYNNITDPTIRANAQAVMNAVSIAVTANHGDTNDHGISIYFPHNCAGYYPTYDTDVLLSVDTNWNDFLKAYCSPPAPPNDNFANAQVISGNSGSVTGSNVGATKEPCEPNHHNIPGGASVWYRWTAPVEGSVTFDTFGSNFDTVLAVYTGNNLCSLTHIASSDDDPLGGLQSRVSFNAVAGTTYHIAVDGFGGFSSPGAASASKGKISTAAVAMGDIVLNWSMCPGVTVTSSPKKVTYKPTPTRPSKKTITVRVTNKSGETRRVIGFILLPEEPFIVTTIRPTTPTAIPNRRTQSFTVYTEVPAGWPPVTATQPYFITVLDCGAFTTASEPQLLVPLQVHDIQVEPQGGQLRVEATGVGIASVRLQLYDLAGRLMLNKESQGDTLTLPFKTLQGRALANGVYLSVVRVRGLDGREYVSEVRKLVILR